jgi:DNA polymerase I-like protein with 3'-5' exonuclease and polymerase domains
VTDFSKLKGFTSTWYEPKWRAFDEPEIALTALAELQRIQGPVTIDIESGIEKDISFEHPQRHTLLCVGLGYQRGKVAVIGEIALRDPRVQAALLHYLQTHPIKAQNGKFDLKGLYPKLKDELDQRVALKLYADTLIKHYCLDERQGVHGLEYMGVEMLGTPLWKSVLDRYRGKHDSYAVVPRPVLYKYNAFDIHVTDLLDDLLDKQLDCFGPENNEPARRRADGQVWGLRDLHNFLCRASDQLQFVELNGLGVDLQYNAELAVQYSASLAVLEERIGNAILNDNWRTTNIRAKEFNPRSPKQVKAVVKDTFGLKLPFKMNQAKEYKETTDEDALTDLLERNLGKSSEEFFRRMLEHRKEAKAYGTYVRGIRNRLYHGRVFPTILLHGTSTGRPSCRNPNLFNIPRQSSLRKQFVPVKEGYTLIEGDYCLTLGTRILKKDLTWDAIENLKVGDELIGFHEENTSTMMPSTVTQTDELTKLCYEITLENGKALTSSHDHKWLACYSGSTQRHWLATSRLKPGQSLLFYVEPWETDDSRDGGWLSGFLDGEGSLDKNKSGKWDGVKFGQNDGPVQDKARRLLQELGYWTTTYRTTKCKEFKVSGPPRAALRLIGQLRPERFLARSEDIWLGRTSCNSHKIVSVRPVNEQKVVAVQTTTHTMVAEGYLTHNCQNEGRTLCWLAQDEYLRTIFNDPERDLFDELTPRLYGNVLGLNKAEMKELRIRVKAYFYGLGYGREAHSIAMEYDIPVSEAERGMREFFKVIPSVVKFREETRAQVLKGKDLITPFGRHRRFWLITKSNRKDVMNEALAFLPQSIASDICMDAFIHIRPRLKGIGFVRNLVYDSILVECKVNKIMEATVIMNEEMLASAERIVGNYVTFKVDFKSGPSWGELS